MKHLFKFILLLSTYGILFETFGVESFDGKWLIMTICLALTYMLGNL